MSINCAQIQRWLDDYRRGVLAPDHATEVENHLGVCPHCQGVFEEIESLAALLRSAPLPPAPPAERLAELNRGVRQRLAERRGLRRLSERVLAVLSALWYHPFTERTTVLAGAAVMLAVGLWAGATLFAPAGRRETQLASLPEVSGVHTPSLGHAGFVDGAAGRRAAAETAEARQEINPFPTVYALLNTDQNAGSAAPAADWMTLASLPPPGERDNKPSLTTGLSLPGAAHASGPAALGDSLTEATLEPGARGDSALALAAQRIVEEDLLGRLRRFKFDLYYSGQTEHIPDVQRIEELLYQLLSTQAGSLGPEGEIDVETQRRFAEAEGYLLNRDYRRAEDLFNDIAHEHSGTRVATLSWYHLGNIYYEFHGDFAGARQCYARCLDGGVEEIVPEEVAGRIRHRMDLLNDAVAADYQPLRLLRQAEAAPAEAVLRHYRRLLTEYPSSAAAADGINSLAERALRDTPTEPNLPVRAIDLLRQYQALPAASHRVLAQLRLADIVYFRLRDLPQALIEYGQVEVSPEDTALEAMVRDRIAVILDNRIGR